MDVWLFVGKDQQRRKRGKDKRFCNDKVIKNAAGDECVWLSCIFLYFGFVIHFLCCTYIKYAAKFAAAQFGILLLRFFVPDFRRRRKVTLACLFSRAQKTVPKVEGPSNMWNFVLPLLFLWSIPIGKLREPIKKLQCFHGWNSLREFLRCRGRDGGGQDVLLRGHAQVWNRNSISPKNRKLILLLYCCVVRRKQKSAYNHCLNNVANAEMATFENRDEFDAIQGKGKRHCRIFFLLFKLYR